MAGTPSTPFAVAVPRPERSTPPAPRPSPHPSAAATAGPFRQANVMLPNRSKVVPVIGVVILLTVVLIPCAATAATRYRRLR